jgi:hypothetical protein
MDQSQTLQRNVAALVRQNHHLTLDVWPIILAKTLVQSLAACARPEVPSFSSMWPPLYGATAYQEAKPASMPLSDTARTVALVSTEGLSLNERSRASSLHLLLRDGLA